MTTTTKTKTPRTHLIPKGTPAPLELNRTFLATEQLGKGSIIFNGEIRKREDVRAELDAQEVATHGVQFFDPQDTVETILTNPVARAAFTSTMLWAITGRIANALRGAYYDMSKAARDTGSIDNHNEFAVKLSEMNANDEYVREMGFHEYSGRLVSIRALVSIRNQWCDIAEAASKAVEIKFRPPGIATGDSAAYAKDLLTDPPQFNADAWTKESFLINWLMGQQGSTPEEIANVLKMARIKADKAHVEMVRTNVEIQPGLRAIYYAAIAKHDNVKFWELPVEMQTSIIESTQRSAKKASESWITRRDITTTDFIMSLPQLKALVTSLGTTLENNKYRVE